MIRKCCEELVVRMGELRMLARSPVDKENEVKSTMVDLTIITTPDVKASSAVLYGISNLSFLCSDTHAKQCIENNKDKDQFAPSIHTIVLPTLPYCPDEFMFGLFQKT